MKWFQHWADSHTNSKTRLLVRKQGWLGYSLMWVCRELVAKEGERYRIKAEKDWKTTLCELFKIEEKELNNLLAYHGEIKLISANALKDGDLYIPKMSEYSDDYTKRVRRVSAQDTDSVHVDKNILDKIRKYYIQTKGWDFQHLPGGEFSRIDLATKKLMKLTKNVPELIIEAIDWTNKKGWDNWSMETVYKYFADFMKHRNQIPAASREVDFERLHNPADA